MALASSDASAARPVRIVPSPVQVVFLIPEHALQILEVLWELHGSLGLVVVRVFKDPSRRVWQLRCLMRSGCRFGRFGPSPSVVLASRLLNIGRLSQSGSS